MIVFHYGIENGILITALTWSFFVLCTPIADAGFLLDFPLRLILCVRMMISEMIVWGIAISLNIYAFFFRPEIYEKTKLLSLFYHILEQPAPFWLIILVSGIGTFVSVRFGDKLLDKKEHKDCPKTDDHRAWVQFSIMAFLVLMSIILYDFLLKQLGVDLPL